MDDVIVIGGGAIGLSVAYDLAKHGHSVRVLERGRLGAESSWAGAGICPPGNRHATSDPYEQLVGLGHELHPVWAEQLREETGIDNGYRKCGGLYVAREAGMTDMLGYMIDHWMSRGIAVEKISQNELTRLEPQLQPTLDSDNNFAAALLPDEGQVRNPRHIKALATACLLRGVTIEEGVPVDSLQCDGTKVVSAGTVDGPRKAKYFCISGGAWSPSLFAALGLQVPIRPVRGQIALLSCGVPPISRVVNEATRYLVPRPDGRVLVGATEEEVGFDKRTTADAIHGLIELARSLVPALGSAEVERCWAGLRPATEDGRPYMGSVPGYENTFAATGHFRSGLQLSPAVGAVMSQLIRGETPEIDLSPFRFAAAERNRYVCLEQNLRKES